jgi:hypothetical protein
MSYKEISQNSIKNIHALSLQAQKADLTAYLMSQTHGIVQAGPFKGMKLSDRLSWGSFSDEAAKVLGFYEEELHAFIEQIIAESPDRILNIGCAEGYYAVGIARRLPQAKVIAFDIDPKAQEITLASATQNNCASHFSVSGEIKVSEIEGYLKGSEHPFLFMDCEGGELTLLDPLQTPSLSKTSILVECHNFLNRTIVSTLQARLSPTHNVEIIAEGERNPNKSPILARLSSNYRWLAVNENRPECMHWIWATPKK